MCSDTSYSTFTHQIFRTVTEATHVSVFHLERHREGGLIQSLRSRVPKSSRKTIAAESHHHVSTPWERFPTQSSVLTRLLLGNQLPVRSIGVHNAISGCSGHSGVKDVRGGGTQPTEGKGLSPREFLHFFLHLRLHLVLLLLHFVLLLLHFLLRFLLLVLHGELHGLLLESRFLLGRLLLQGHELLLALLLEGHLLLP